VSASNLERCHERPDGAVTNGGIAPFRVTDYGDGKQRAGITWPFDTEGNYLNSRSRVNLRAMGRLSCTFHAHFRLHRARRSDRLHAGSGSDFLSTQVITLRQG